MVTYTNFHVDSETKGYAVHWDSFERSSKFVGSDQILDGFGGNGDVTKNLNGARFGAHDNDINSCAHINNARLFLVSSLSALTHVPSLSPVTHESDSPPIPLEENCVELRAYCPFTRTWETMKRGLPLFKGTHFYFLGLENLHQLTKHVSYDLLIYVWVIRVNNGLLLYKNFRVDAEAEGYACHWDYFKQNTSVNLSDHYLDGFGGAGDGTKNLNGARFATYNKDLNGCASSKGSGWWYNPIGCTSLLFEPDGLHWPVNRTGTIEIEKMDYVQIRLERPYWYVDDDLVL
ncbi:fibrinogen C domain-containing protein 1-like [Haliotis asinina]|uniref:fibrinogen C domain-containing protein 1-like n=1 Tax=Haliotis asinina TaxID=109174 RepID=UPI0035318AB3